MEINGMSFCYCACNLPLQECCMPKRRQIKRGKDWPKVGPNLTCHLETTIYTHISPFNPLLKARTEWGSVEWKLNF